MRSKTDPASGEERPMSASYQASAYLDDEEGELRIGLRGRAKIHVAKQTLGRRFWRFLTRTFNFDL